MPSIAGSPERLQEKFIRLRQMLGEMQSVVVAFSAGADSTLILKLSIDALGKENVLAVTARSDSLARAELEDAVALAKNLSAPHLVVETDEFDNPNYTSNPANRCYFCKTTLYSHLQRIADQRGFKNIINGINADDLGDYRPGLQAAKEHAVRSPMAEVGLSKAEVRDLSRRLGLPTFDKPASPCLSSRIPYGEEVTPSKLRMIEAAEAFLCGLGIPECRVRHHDMSARIEVAPQFFELLAKPQVARRTDEHLRSLGYTSVVLDLRGFRSGSLNEFIDLSTPRSASTPR